MSGINEFEVREVLGVKDARDQDCVILTEKNESIAFAITDEAGFRRVAVLSPPNARRLAMQLHRLARRIEDRLGCA